MTEPAVLSIKKPRKLKTIKQINGLWYADLEIDEDDFIAPGHYIEFNKEHMARFKGYFYMIDEDLDVLIQKTDDGITAFQFPLEIGSPHRLFRAYSLSRGQICQMIL